MKPKIQESSGVTDKSGKLSRPDAGSLVMRSDDCQWERDGSTGFSYKSLFEDLQTGQRTVLMKVDAGTVATSHAHENLEQVFLLKGDFYDEHRTYRAGDFIVRAPGAVHTGGSKGGALALLIYSE